MAFSPIANPCRFLVVPINSPIGIDRETCKRAMSLPLAKRRLSRLNAGWREVKEYMIVSDKRGRLVPIHTGTTSLVPCMPNRHCIVEIGKLTRTSRIVGVKGGA